MVLREQGHFRKWLFTVSHLPRRSRRYSRTCTAGWRKVVITPSFPGLDAPANEASGSGSDGGQRTNRAINRLRVARTVKLARVNYEVLGISGINYAHSALLPCGQAIVSCHIRSFYLS